MKPILCSLLLHSITAFGMPGNDTVQVQLLATEAAPFTVALKFTIKPEWYLYWKNPGDAGLPIEVKWDLPEGYRVGELLHPTPSKFVYDEVIAYGYKRELVLLCTLTPPPGTPRAGGTVRANIDWLVCKESCVRGSATTELVLGSGESILTKEELDFHTHALPVPSSNLGVSSANLRVESKDDELTAVIDLTGTPSHRITDFYPEMIPNFVIDHHGITTDGATIRIPIRSYETSSTLQEMRGLLVANGIAYELVARGSQ